MATISGVQTLNQYFINGVMEGFLPLVAPLYAFSYNVNQVGAVLNDHVRVPFAASPTSASSNFTYANGYSGNNGNIQGKDVQLSNLLYQPLQLTDAEMQVLSPGVLEKQGRLLGGYLGKDVVSASFNSITTANFTTQTAYSASQYSSSAAMPDADLKANTNNWPDGEGYRYLIAGTTMWNALLNNSQINAAYAFGGVDVVQRGTIPQFFGFKPFKTTVTFQTKIGGFFCNPNALVVAMAYHKPGPAGASILTQQAQITDEKTGATIGFREWYDPVKATTNRVFDCLVGSAVGDSNALLWVTT